VAGFCEYVDEQYLEVKLRNKDMTSSSHSC